MKKELVFLFVASLAQIVTPNEGPIEEWRKDCNSQSEKIVIHSAGGNWTNLSSDLTTHQQYGVYRKFTCTADPGHFAFVQINHKMDFPSDTKTITCGKTRKWLHKGDVVVTVGCYMGPRANWIQKPKEEERILKLDGRASRSSRGSKGLDMEQHPV
ncbi:unnamed protein product, partial [Mesorhabditis belari]|uniref:Uncharacterized protein n=1 Tax=Mesorhabditis belari TaxID=2138241 RepID=A0AAF3F5N3_9BILA